MNEVFSLESGTYFQCDLTKKIHLKVTESCDPIKSPKLSVLKTVLSGKPIPQRSSSEATGLKPDIDLPPVGLQGCPPEFSARDLTRVTLTLCLEVPLLLAEQYFPWSHQKWGKPNFPYSKAFSLQTEWGLMSFYEENIFPWMGWPISVVYVLQV